MDHSLRLLLSMPHNCSYLDNQQASDLFVDPDAPMDSFLYSQLAQQGFRRSGDNIYRPHCQSCSACKAVRLPVDEFQRSRQQRRAWQRNSDLTISATTTPNKEEHFALYQEYVKDRHEKGGMDEFEKDGLFSFFQSNWGDTLFYEFRNPQHELITVAVCDVLSDGLSAVYSYFKPCESKRSLGVMAVLWQIEQAKQFGLPYLYLGYWIDECQKMSYKKNYQPLTWFDGKTWSKLATSIT